jgi:hypothetical protein
VVSWEPGPHLAEHGRSWWGGILFLALMMTWTTGWGALVVGHLPPRKDLLGLVFVMGAGLWLLSVAVLVTGLFSVSFVPMLFAGLLVWVTPTVRWHVRMTGLSTERVDWWTRFLMMAVWVGLLMAICAALPPASDPAVIAERLDGVLSHRSIGTITELSSDAWRIGNVDCLAMLHLFSLSVQSDFAVRMMDCMFGVMSLVAVGAVGTLLWSRFVGWMAAACFYLQPLWHEVGLAPRVDMITVLFAVLAYGCVLAWGRQDDDAPDQRYLWMSALATGMAVATSWTAVMVVAVPVMVLIGLKVMMMSAGQRWRRLWRWPVVLALVLAPVAPWVIHAMIVDPESLPVLVDRALAFDAGGLLDAVNSAIRFTLSEPWAAPPLLMTMPVTLLHRKLEATVRDAFWLLVMVYAGWLVGDGRSMVMMMSAAGLAAWVGAYGVERFCRRGSSRWLIHGAMVVMVGVCLMKQATVLIGAGETYPGFVPYLLGQSSRDTQVSRLNGGIYEPVAWVNENVPGSARLLMVAESSPLYSRVPVTWAVPADHHPIWPILEGASSLTLKGRMADRGITHAYVDHAVFQKWRDQLGAPRQTALETFEKFLRRHAKVIHKTEGVTVYAIDP